MKKGFTIILMTFLLFFGSANVVHADSAKGKLEVDVHFDLPIKNVANTNISLKIDNQTFTDSLTIPFNLTESSWEGNMTVGNQPVTVRVRKLNKDGSLVDTTSAYIHYYAVTIYGLPTGKYALQLSGTGYKRYNLSNINIDTYSKRVNISNGKGGFEVGDVNGDGVVNHNDADSLIAAIGSTDCSTRR